MWRSAALPSRRARIVSSKGMPKNPYRALRSARRSICVYLGGLLKFGGPFPFPPRASARRPGSEPQCNQVFGADHPYLDPFNFDSGRIDECLRRQRIGCGQELNLEVADHDVLRLNRILAFGRPCIDLARRSESVRRRTQSDQNIQAKCHREPPLPPKSRSPG